MNMLARRLGPLTLAFATPLLISAACEPGHTTLSIKHANGLIVFLAPNSSAYDFPLIAQLDTYETIYLGPQDTLLVSIDVDCSNLGELSRDGSPQTPSSTTFMGPWIFKCTNPGNYEGGNCEMACKLFEFSLAPLASAQGSVLVRPTILLDGPTTSGVTSNTMRTDLKNAGLLPGTEPYTALGYTHTGGGGGETLTTNALGRPLVDWVLVELRSAAQPATVIASQAALVLSQGFVIDSDGGDLSFAVPPGYYHVAFKHRNHLGVMTAQPVLLSGPPTLVDMSNNSIPVFGTQPLKQNGLRYRLWCGNAQLATGNQQIKYTGSGNDRDPILTRVGSTTPNSTVSGYFTEDVTLDGVVKYTGTDNDRDRILITIGSTTPNVVRSEQLP